MFRFFLFLRGYYLIKVQGFGTERFINLCKAKNIYLWAIQMSHNEYRMKISMDDYKLLTEIVNKTGVKVDILKKYGLPFLFFKKKNRLFYCCFILVALILIFISNLFVWKIEFEGNYMVSEEQLNDFLRSFEVEEGVLKKEIPYVVLEEQLRKEFPIIKWCSVALSGNVLYIRIEENNLLKDENTLVASGIYSDIVSQADGVVTSVLVRNGLAQVKAGDKVTKGQILVTGAVPIYDDSLQIKNYHYYDADADVIIETSISYEDKLDTVYFQKEYTGRKKEQAYIKINNKDIHLPFSPGFAYYDTYTTTRQLKLFNSLVLPVYYGTHEAREYYLVEQEYSKDEVQKIFNEKLMNYYISLSEKGVQILQKDVKIEHNANNWGIKGNFIVSINNSQKEYREQQVENIIQ